MGRNILVLNLTRMGDLIQTTPLIRGLREKEPGCRITMLANDRFAGILKFVDGIDELVTFDIHGFGAPGGGEELDVLALYEYLDGLIHNLMERGFDIIINLSHSKISAVLSMLIGAPDVRGFLSTPRGERLVKNPWLVYFTAFLAFRRYNRFNLVDMYMRGAGVEPSAGTRLHLNPDTSVDESVKAEMVIHDIKPGQIVIGLQAGASREERRWEPANFAKVGDALAEKYGAKIVLFGAAQEKKLGDEITSTMKYPAVNLMGQTSLPQLVAWVKHINLLVTNDTGTMHIAAALGTPIVSLFFVHARCEETGPYCAGAMALQADIPCAPCSHQATCDHYSCLKYITAEDVTAVCESAITKSGAPLDAAGLFGRVRLYASSLGESGGVEFVPLKKYPMDKYELFAYLYEPLFLQGLGHWDSPEKIASGSGLFNDAVLKLQERFKAPDGEQLKIWLNRAREGAEKLITLAEETVSITGSIVKGDVGKNSMDPAKMAETIQRIDTQAGIMARTYDAVSPLIYTYRRRQENFEGEDPKNIARQASLAARWLMAMAGAFNVGLSAVERGFLVTGTDKNISTPIGG
ncbi:MAG: glycosyltransferase family 9 protein [Nitrospinae bacterium]|nr:glycosyltransferase family 9 protein [Nitrospinota bacterium]